eukprot:687976-Pyramimonas_sp.AAC.1
MFTVRFDLDALSRARLRLRMHSLHGVKQVSLDPTWGHNLLGCISRICRHVQISRSYRALQIIAP